MHNKNKREAAVSTAAGGVAGGVPVKERVFSIIRKALEEGITDGSHMLWLDFSPNVAVVKKEDGYTVWLWRGCVAVKILLDNDFNVIGFDVERP